MHKSFFFSCVACPTRSEGPMADLPEEALEELNQAKTTNVYKKGQIIFYEGNQPFGLYCINQGKIKLYKYAPEGKEYIVRLSQAGDMLGYRAFFTGEPYSATAEVLEDASICFLDKAVFFQVLKKEPALSIKLLERMGRDLRCAENKARDLAYKSAQERIIELLLTLMEAYGIVQKDGSVKLDLAVAREDVANMLGTTTETAVRLLTWLKEKGVLAASRKAIIIQDPDKLAGMLVEY